jgi:SAP domain
MARALMPRDWSLDEALSRKLTEDERRLLISWNMQSRVEDNDRVFGDGEPGEDLTKIDDGNTGDTDPFTADTGEDVTSLLVKQGHAPVADAQAARAAALARGESDLDADLEAQRDAESDLSSSLAPEEEGAADGQETDEYSGMKNSALREVLDQRGLPRSGNRDELLARLRTADAEA